MTAITNKDIILAYLREQGSPRTKAEIGLALSELKLKSSEIAMSLVSLVKNGIVKLENDDNCVSHYSIIQTDDSGKAMEQAHDNSAEGSDHQALKKADDKPALEPITLDPNSDLDAPFIEIIQTIRQASQIKQVVIERKTEKIDLLRELSSIPFLPEDKFYLLRSTIIDIEQMETNA
jgi:DNA-binding MarR family transcriptional regulator